MNEKQRLAWEKKYLTQGALWSRSYDVWFETAEGQRILDLGCGPGKSCASMKGDVIAADFSISALKMLCDSIKNASAVCCDVCMLPFVDSSFDLVRASFIFGHLDEEERLSTIDEISRVLKHGGKFALEVFSTADARFAMRGKPRKTDHVNEDGIYHFYFDKGEVQSLLSDFSKISICEIIWNQRVGPKTVMERKVLRATATRP